MSQRPGERGKRGQGEWSLGDKGKNSREMGEGHDLSWSLSAFFLGSLSMMLRGTERAEGMNFAPGPVSFLLCHLPNLPPLLLRHSWSWSQPGWC